MHLMYRQRIGPVRRLVVGRVAQHLQLGFAVLHLNTSTSPSMGSSCRFLSIFFIAGDLGVVL